MNVTSEELGIFLKKIVLMYWNNEEAPEGLSFSYGNANYIRESTSYYPLVLFSRIYRFNGKSTPVKNMHISDVINIDDKFFYINSLVLDSMSTNDFYNDYFALSTIHDKDTLYKIHLCSYLSSLHMNSAVLFQMSALTNCYLKLKESNTI